MGNNPINGIDPDGGYKREFWANFFNVMFGGNGVRYNKEMEEYYFVKTYESGKEIYVSPIYETPFYVSGNLRVDYGLQAGTKVNISGITGSIFGEYRTKPLGDIAFMWNPSSDDSFDGYCYDIANDNFLPSDLIKTSWSASLLVGVTREYELGKFNNKLFSVGSVKHKSTHVPIIGNSEKNYSGLNTRKLTHLSHSWGLSGSAAAFLGIKGNIRFGFNLNFK
jgi:hypothetical protein